MARKLNILEAFLFLLSASTAKAESGVYDVTTAAYGAKPSSDITQALAKPWTDACASPEPSKVVVPSGTYMLTEASFKGPCKAPIEIQVQGKLQAPTDGGKLTKPDTWVGFEHINMLTVSGGGTFDGQRALAWKKNDCNPVLIDQQYCLWNQCKQNVPSKVKISNVSFKNIKGSSATPLAVQIVCSNGIPCENVELADINLIELADINLTYNGNKGPLTSQCSNVKSTITRVPNALACATSS